MNERSLALPVVACTPLIFTSLDTTDQGEILLVTMSPPPVLLLTLCQHYIGPCGQH